MHWIIKARVEVIVLEAIAQTPKYQPLGFWLQLVKYRIINGVVWPLGCYHEFAWTCISGEEIFMNNNYIYDHGCRINKARVEVIELEAVAQTPKYQPLGFGFNL